MSSLESRSSGEESREFKVESSYNFPEIGELEKSFVALLEELKEGIDENRWPVLISDDGGGRIPTLVLRKIIEARTGSAPQTFFIAGGSYTPEFEDSEKEAAFVEYLKEIKKKVGEARVLLTTQYIESGKSMLKIVYRMKQVGFQNVEIAALSTARHYASIQDFKVYSASPRQETLKNRHEFLTGVDKDYKNYQPYPTTRVKALNQGRTLSAKRVMEIFGILDTDLREDAIAKRNDPAKIEEYDKERFAPLTVEEEDVTRTDIRLAREDFSLLAKKVVERVWSK
jgi:hypoxanthine-guanine phosphoribosyltransferase